MRILGAIILATVVMLGAGGAAAQYTVPAPPAEHAPSDAALAHDQMMRMMQQMGVTASRLAVLLHSGQLTPERQAEVADVLAEMAQVMNWTAAAMGQRSLDDRAMAELDRMMEEMARMVRQATEQAAR